MGNSLKVDEIVNSYNYFNPRKRVNEYALRGMHQKHTVHVCLFTSVAEIDKRCKIFIRPRLRFRCSEKHLLNMEFVRVTSFKTKRYFIKNEQLFDVFVCTRLALVSPSFS